MALKRMMPLSAVLCLVLQGASGCFFPEFQAADGNAGGGTDGGGGGTATAGGAGPTTGGGGTGSLVVPDGWDGPFVVIEQATEDPECPPNFASVGSGQAGLTNEPPSCSDCSCTGGGACGQAVVRFYTNTTCTGAQAFVGTAVPGQCNPFSATGVAASAIIQSGDESGASCTVDPNGGQLEGMPQAFETYINLCEPPANCDDLSCVEPTPSKVCITADGSEECPAGFQDELPKVYFGQVDDQRACGTCSCGSPSCLYSTSLFLNSMCQFVPKTISNVCSSVNVASSPLTVALNTPAAAATPTCPTTTGAASTEVNVSDPFTVCCRSNE